jgi:hypothetical protein
MTPTIWLRPETGVIAAGKKVGTATGMHCMDPAGALARAEQGMQFIAVPSDPLP